MTGSDKTAMRVAKTIDYMNGAKGNAAWKVRYSVSIEDNQNHPEVTFTNKKDAADYARATEWEAIIWYRYKLPDGYLDRELIGRKPRNSSRIQWVEQ